MATLDDYVIPRGIAFFDPFDANGNTTGEIDMGNTPGFNLGVESTNLEHFSSRGGLNEKDRDVATGVNRTASMTIDNLAIENMGYFAISTQSAIVQVATPVVDEAITVQKDRWYQLGVAANATGVRNVSAVVVQDVTDTTTYVLGTDYNLDLPLGRIQIIAGGAIANDDVLHIDYTPTAETRQQLVADTNPVKGAMRVVSDNPEGSNKDYYFPSVNLKPTGEMPIIGAEDAWATIGFDIGINKKDANTPALFIDGRGV
tara:strand:+ start:1879 stop:2652 length:774 start_codon:yes stop_codon:yes gene_type:complete